MVQTLGKRERIHIFRKIPDSTLKLYPIMNPVAVADEYSTTKNESGMVKTCIGKHG
jgi:hypothetical protein